MHRDEEGEWKYDDGSDLKENGNGGWIERYVADDGTMEYDLYLVGRSDQSLIGQKMHLEFQNLGTVEKAAFTPDITGTWAFDIELKGSEETRRRSGIRRDHAHIDSCRIPFWRSGDRSGGGRCNYRRKIYDHHV